MASNPFGTSSPSSFDPLLLPSLLSRLHLRPPLPSRSPLDDLLLQSLSTVDHHPDLDEDNDDLSLTGDDEKRRRLLAREVARLEREVIRIIQSGDSDRLLKPNSGRSVAIGDHNICVASRDEPGSEYRVWEWHGHIMFFDHENGFDAEYIYGNYFERLPERKGGRNQPKDDEEEEMKLGGLRDLIGDSMSSVMNGGGRVIHRNSLGASSSNSNN
ncbi:hypothetical protein IHE45_09G074100 [Dioscorea alata]|uniref:Uncharacterized protein n=2 Tax=Dioscorea alata TaxID=55571 RepID=A0ACB7VG58_DIOAL|nr:hypothetical protein IHE45_09G074100 [Dioscorea alata]KAH7672706.1 hypothetical protein IHE45_09G074100 [Dioscorea alata]